MHTVTDKLPPSLHEIAATIGPVAAMGQVLQNAVEDLEYLSFIDRDMHRDEVTRACAVASEVAARLLHEAAPYAPELKSWAGRCERQAASYARATAMRGGGLEALDPEIRKAIEF